MKRINGTYFLGILAMYISSLGFAESMDELRTNFIVGIFRLHEASKEYKSDTPSSSVHAFLGRALKHKIDAEELKNIIEEISEKGNLSIDDIGECGDYSKDQESLQKIAMLLKAFDENQRFFSGCQCSCFSPACNMCAICKVASGAGYSRKIDGKNPHAHLLAGSGRGLSFGSLRPYFLALPQYAHNVPIGILEETYF